MAALNHKPKIFQIAGKTSDGEIVVMAVDSEGKPILSGALIYRGVWDANTNTPTLSDSGGGGSTGDYYVVSANGTTTIDGISDWSIGDWIVNNGTVWQKADHTDVVTSVFGRQGAVVAAASDYDASQVDNDSGVAGAFVSDALDTNAAAIGLNTTHRGSDGTDHSDVGLNNTHRTSAGTDHSDVGLNNTHRGSDGSDHGFIDQSVVIGSAPSLLGTNITGIITGSVENIHLDVRKGSAGTIAAGVPVYLAGYNAAGWIEVEAADAAAAATMPAIGMHNGSITNAATVQLTQSGQLTALDTSTGAPSVNDSVYVASGGGWTVTKPTGTNLIQKIGLMTRVHGSQGVITMVGAGRSNDVPNIPSNEIWLGNGSAVATPTNFDTKVTANSTVINNRARVKTVQIDGNGFAITTGQVLGYFSLPIGAAITSVRMSADQSTTTTIDIWMDTYANFPPDNSDSITAAAVPTISAALKSEDSTLTGWTTAVVAGNMFALNVDANNNAEHITIELFYTVAA